MYNAKEAVATAEITTIDDTWPEIIPLDASRGNEQPYPLDALPPVARDAVTHYLGYGRQPIPLIACSAIAAMSYATQGLANVARDELLVSPLSISLLLSAKSGERKTASDRIFMSATREWERERIDESKEKVTQAKAELKLHEEKEKALLQKVRKCVGSSSKLDELAAVEHQLAQLQKERPYCPLPFQAVFSDVNQQTLAVSLADGHPSAALFSDEAAVLIGGNGMSRENALQFFGFINTMWDGSSFKRNRLTTESAWIMGRRLTTSLMMQPSVLQELLGIKGGQCRGTGFLARSLFAQPCSTMGTRLYQPPPNLAFMEPFNNRVRELLDTPLPIEDEANMRLSPEILQLSSEAKALWVTYHNEVEREISAEGEYAVVDDFASKSAENAARLAGVFHVFEHGGTGEISAETMQGAIAIAGWHLDETRRVFMHMETPVKTQNARVLINWLIQRESNEVATSEIGQLSPRSIRKKECWEPAIHLLCEHGYVAPDTKRANYYLLNPKAKGDVSC